MIHKLQKKKNVIFDAIHLGSLTNISMTLVGINFF